MIKCVANEYELLRWVKFTKRIYPRSSNFVPPLYKVLKQELRVQVFKLHKYTALMCLRDKKMVGRVLFTYSISKVEKVKTCYFSYFDCFNDESIVKELFDYVIEDMKKHDCHNLEGTYCPYDADNKRGILVEGYEYPPMVFCSYNYEYYPKLLEQYGFVKAYDTLALSADPNEENLKKAEHMHSLVTRMLPNIRVEHLDIKHPDRQLQDLVNIMEEATTEMNFTAAPDISFLKNFVKQYKFFLISDFIALAYDGDIPVGFTVVLPNYNQLFKLLNGKRNLIRIVINKRKVNQTRGILQYVIPAYQKKGVIGILYNDIMHNVVKHKCRVFEASTILESNVDSTNVVEIFKGRIYKRYRIYRKAV